VFVCFVSNAIVFARLGVVAVVGSNVLWLQPRKRHKRVAEERGGERAMKESRSAHEERADRASTSHSHTYTHMGPVLKDTCSDRSKKDVVAPFLLTFEKWKKRDHC
jgi:hypothetical protein